MAVASPPPSQSITSFGRTRDSIPLASIPSAATGRTRSTPYGPAFSKRFPDPPKRPSRTFRNRRLNPADVAAFRESLDAFFPDKQQSSATKEYKKAAEHDADIEQTQAAPQPHFRWADLLDKVASSDRLPRDRKQTPIEGLADFTSTTIPRGKRVQPQSSHQQQDPHEENLLQRDVTSEQEAQALKEEFESLKTPAEVVQFLQERLFGPDGLASKVSDPLHATDARLQQAYPYLLTDVSRSLRLSGAPHAALLPLALAAAYSPASYFHGCTTTLYTSTMKTRWHAFADIEGCLRIMQEMDRGAVNVDQRVVALVKEMQDAVVKDRQRAERQARIVTAAKKAEADAAAAIIPGEGIPSSSFAVASTNNSPTVLLHKDEAVSEKAFERLVEEHTYFSPAERRALRTMEKIIMENRERQQAERRKEYDLEDAIRAQSRLASSSSSSSSGSGAGAAEAAPETSSINALINSYGSFDRPKSAAVPAEELAQRLPRRGRRRDRFERQGRIDPTEDPQNLNQNKTQSQRAASHMPAFDVLSQAVSELSQKPSKQKTAMRRRPKSGKGKTKVERRLGAEQTGTENASAFGG